jgi:hypothetical protein
LEKYTAREMAKLSKRDPHLARTKIAQLMDNVDTINTLAETVTSVEELTRKLEMLFNDEAGAASVMCSTVRAGRCDGSAVAEEVRPGLPQAPCLPHRQYRHAAAQRADYRPGHAGPVTRWDCSGSGCLTNT